jgi:hypothetical protein
MNEQFNKTCSWTLQLLFQKYVQQQPEKTEKLRKRLTYSYDDHGIIEKHKYENQQMMVGEIEFGYCM